MWITKIHTLLTTFESFTLQSACFLPHEEVSRQLILQSINNNFLLVLEKKWRVLQSSAWKLLLKISQFVCQNASVTVTHLFHASLVIPGSLHCNFVMFYATGCSFNKYAVVSLYCTSFASTFIFLPAIAVSVSLSSYIRETYLLLMSPGLSPDCTHTSVPLRCCPEQDICWHTDSAFFTKMETI